MPRIDSQSSVAPKREEQDSRRVLDQLNKQQISQQDQQKDAQKSDQKRVEQQRQDPQGTTTGKAPSVLLATIGQSVSGLSKKFSSEEKSKIADSVLESADIDKMLFGEQSSEDTVKLSKPNISQQQGKVVEKKHDDQAQKAAENPHQAAKDMPQVVSAQAEQLNKMKKHEKAKAQNEDVSKRSQEAERPETNAALTAQSGLAQADQMDKNRKTQSKKEFQAELKSDAKSFVSTFTQTMLGQAAGTQIELDQRRQALREKGVTQRQISEMESKVQHQVRERLEEGLKEVLIKSYLASPNSLEKFGADNQFHQFIGGSVFNKQLGRLYVGNYKGGVDGFLNSAKAEAAADVNVAIQESLDEAVMQGKMNKTTTNQTMQRIKDLQVLGRQMGFDFDAWAAKIEEKVINSGLAAVDLSKVNGQPQPEEDGKNSQDAEEDDYQPSEEADLKSELVAVFLEELMHGSPRVWLATQVKLFKLKKRIKVMGLPMGETLEKARTEAMAIAKLKSLDLIKECFFERATLVDFKGSTYKAIEKRLEMMKKVIKKVGQEVSELELDSMRDDANYQVFKITKNELIELEVQLKIEPNNIFLIRKHKQIMTILERLKKESKIMDEIGTKLLNQTVSFGREVSIKGDA